MRKIKEAITDLAIASGYSGDEPKSIARAIDTLAGVSSSGGGGGGSNVVVVPWEENASDMTITLGMTVNEIAEALRAGKVVVIDLDESTITSGVCQVSFVRVIENDTYELGGGVLGFGTKNGLNAYPQCSYYD